MTAVVVWATIAVALGAAIVGGIFFAFSSFVMAGLHETGPVNATRTMQSINRTVITPSFLGLFLGTAVGAIVVTVVRWDEPEAVLVLAATVTYVVGTLAVTVRSNIPRNEALDRVALSDGAVDVPWNDYHREWTRWNHVRALASVVASVLLILSIA